MNRDHDKPLDASRTLQRERADEQTRQSPKQNSQQPSEILAGREPLDGVFASPKSEWRGVQALGKDIRDQETASRTPEREAAERSAWEARETMLTRKAEVIQSIDGWKPENWRDMSVAKRWETITKTEEALRALEGRDSVPIRPLDGALAAGPDAPHGRTLGTYYGKAVAIEIHPDVVARASPEQALRTYLHEEHHVEQLHAIRDPASRPDFSALEIAAWKTDKTKEDTKALKLGLDISNAEYKQFAHEVSSRYNETTLFLRVSEWMKKHG